jgi:membrane-bound metal-dependent hydrolase YbcI (DUF457 family)
MFAGHVGAALAIARAEPRLNVGAFVGAALLLDVALWLLVLLGWESLAIPADFASTHQPRFVFPYSHGLAAGLVWSCLAAAGAWAVYRRLGTARARAAVLVAAAVFSHWLLDALVHRPEMPLLGASSRAVGLALSDNMPLALAVEAALVLVGMALFMTGSGLPRDRLQALAILSLVILAFSVAGMTIAPPPPSAFAMAASSLLTVVVVCVFFAWLGRHPRSA